MKVRKIFLSPILMMAITSMSGCSNPFAKAEGFKIYWKNYDGSILEIDTMKSRLDMPQYDGNIPTKPTDDAATYTFAGWDKEITPVWGETTFTATFTETPREYKVHWLNYDNSELAVTSVAYGSVPEYTGSEPVRPGNLVTDYTFAGWDRELSPVLGESSYKATFNKIDYKVVYLSYIFNQTAHTPVHSNIAAVRAGTTVNLEAATCAGYDFSGWFLDSAHTKPATVLPNLSDNIVLYGLFDIHTFSITYELGNGGEIEGTNPSELTCLETADLINPTRTGYKFVNWTDQHGNVLTKLEDVCEDLKLKANYKANEYVITLRYSEKNDEYRTIKYDEKVNLPQLSKSGYNFLGWYYEDDPETKFELEYYTLLHDIYLIQKWSEPIEYTISYNLDGGENPVDAPTLYSIVNQPALPEPTKEGYVFEGWYDGTKKVELLRGIFKNLELTAKWSPKDVALSFDYDGGSLQREVKFVDSEATLEAVKISPFENAGYKLLEDKENAQFNGWFNELLQRETFASNKTVQDDLILKAQWVTINSGVVGAKIGTDSTFEVDGFNNKYYQYTPLVAQTVEFESIGDIDVKAELSIKGANQVLKSDDDSGEDKNFKLSFNLAANTTYLLKVSSSYNGQGTVTIKSTSNAASPIPTGKINSVVYTIDSSKQKFDEKFVSVGTPVKEGKVFNGWVDENNQPYNADTVLKALSISLKASWIDA